MKITIDIDVMGTEEENRQKAFEVTNFIREELNDEHIGVLWSEKRKCFREDRANCDMSDSHIRDIVDNKLVIDIDYDGTEHYDSTVNDEVYQSLIQNDEGNILDADDDPWFNK